MTTELQSPPLRRPPVQLSGNVTTAVLVATAAADDGGAAAALPWGSGIVLDRLLQQVTELGFEDVHVITRPQFEETLRASAGQGGAMLHVCAGPSEDLAVVAEMADGASGGFVVAQADVIVHRGALEGLLASPGIATGVLGTGIGGGGTFGMRGRLARGRLVSASSAYHSVSGSRMSFLGVLKVAASDTEAFATAAAELHELMADGLPEGWPQELEHKTEQWRMALGRAALKSERRVARDALEAAGRSRDELPPMEPEEFARRRRELARALPAEDEAELALRREAAREGVGSL